MLVQELLLFILVIEANSIILHSTKSSGSAGVAVSWVSLSWWNAFDFLRLLTVLVFFWWWMWRVSSLHKSCGISNFPSSISLLTSLIPAFTRSLSINDGTECSEFTGTGCGMDNVDEDSGKMTLLPEDGRSRFSDGTVLSKLFDTISTIGFSEKVEAGRGWGWEAENSLEAGKTPWENGVGFGGSGCGWGWSDGGGGWLMKGLGGGGLLNVPGLPGLLGRGWPVNVLLNSERILDLMLLREEMISNCPCPGNLRFWHDDLWGWPAITRITNIDVEDSLNIFAFLMLSCQVDSFN